MVLKMTLATQWSAALVENEFGDCLGCDVIVICFYYAFQMVDSGDDKKATLEITIQTASFPKTYNLVAQNDQGSTSQAIIIEKKKSKSSSLVLTNNVLPSHIDLIRILPCSAIKSENFLFHQTEQLFLCVGNLR